uniref:Uncharacterized protein n=1 Tax=Amphimedon queenslandica TaxID=400682 RepID=A0A1X7TG62_AMPQE
MTLYSNGADPDITVPCTVTNKFIDRSLFCDTWVLDDVSVPFKYNGRLRIIYEEDFDDSESISPGWDITNEIQSKDLMECSEKDDGCLYFDEGIEMSTHQAVSPIITISLIVPVQLPIPIYYEIACQPTEEISATVSFLLHLRQFVQATPTTNFFPNIILLSLVASGAGQYTNTQLAYYAPVVSFCIHKNTELVSLIWTQKTTFLTMIFGVLANQLTSLNYTNGDISNQSVCTGPMLLMDKGDGLIPCVANVTFIMNNSLSSGIGAVIVIEEDTTVEYASKLPSVRQLVLLQLWPHVHIIGKLWKNGNLTTSEKLCFLNKYSNHTAESETLIIELKVQTVTSHNFDIVSGISSEANSISLPNEIFNTSTVP